MNTKQQSQETKTPQMPVRSNVRSGGDIQTCMANLQKWQERYYYWYNQAHSQGKI